MTQVPQAQPAVEEPSNLHHFTGSYAELCEMIQQNFKDSLFVIDFFAPWCPPCQALGKRLPLFCKKYPDVHFIKINTEENRFLSLSYLVLSIPKIKVGVLDEKGGVKVLKTISGANYAEIEKAIVENLKVNTSE